MQGLDLGPGKLKEARIRKRKPLSGPIGQFRLVQARLTGMAVAL